MKELNSGVFPTMITPYKGNEIDCHAVSEIVDYYVEAVAAVFSRSVSRAK